MRKIFLLMALLGLGLASCDKNNEPARELGGDGKVNIGTDDIGSEEGDDSLNGTWSEPVVITPAELCIDLAEGNSIKFTTSEPSYLWGIYLLGESLEFSPDEILGWLDNGAVLVWTCKDKHYSLPFEMGSDWYTISQIDEVTFEVTVGDVNEERLISLDIGSRIYGREPAVADIIIKPAK